MAVQLLTQADGYGIIVGLSILFCLIILAAVRIQKRYLSEDSDQSEMFMVANRSVGTGLTASAVFSSWMWINESVFSAAYTYKWGIALPIWWASGLSFQIALMAVLGIVAKLRVPYAHTSLEFIRMRYGNYAHWIFIVLNLINNIFGCGSMILAGAQLVTGMTGMHVVAACVLIPAGVVIYTAVGGLKATFLTDFLHTTVALILLIYFSLAVLSNEHIGGVSGLYEKVKATDDYISGNYEGSLLTMKSKSVNSGMVMPYVLRSLLGKGATTGLLVLVFMAITSTVSSSMIAVSSIISLDFFRTYINPAASDRKTLKVSHWGVVFHGCFMAGFAIMLEYAGATNNWSTYFRPIIACPGILPMIFTLLWSRQTKLAAILSPILGLMSGVATWLSLSWYWSGALNIQTTQVQIPGLYGAIVSFFSPAIYSIVISLIWPSKFDWREFLRIGLIEDKSQTNSSLTSTIPSSEGVNQLTHAGDEKKTESYTTSGDEAGPPSPPSITPNSQLPLDDVVHPFGDETIKHINKWLKIASVFFVVNVLVTIVLWPIPLYRDWIFTKSFFSGWIVMAIIWHFFAILAVVIYPVWDGRLEIVTVLKGMKGEWKR
ncbi:urea active transporter [Botrytis cinerea]